MKNLPLRFGLLALVFGGSVVEGQNPATQPPPVMPPTVTKPAAPPVIAVPPTVEGKQVEVPPIETAPAQDEVSTAAQKRRAAHVIGPEDILMIRVWDQPNLSGQVTVGPDGMISLQLIDEVKADGLTLEQLKRTLTERLKAFIVNPDVNVQLLRGNSRKFIIQGEVNRPGSFPLTGPTTMLEALVYASGFKEFANPKKIYLLRTEIDPQTKKPVVKRFKFNYKEVSHGKNMEQNILVLNGDQIYVP